MMMFSLAITIISLDKEGKKEGREGGRRVAHDHRAKYKLTTESIALFWIPVSLALKEHAIITETIFSLTKNLSSAWQPRWTEMGVHIQEKARN